MGHEIKVRKIYAKSFDEIMGKIRETSQRYQEQVSEDSYYDYIEIGPVKALKKHFDFVKDAEDYVVQHAYDNEVTAVCSYNQRVSSKYASLCKRLEEEKKKLADYETKHSIASFKAKTIGCPRCESKLTISYLRSNNCPVCGKELRSPTTINTIDGYLEKIRTLEKDIKCEEKEMSGKRLQTIEKRYVAAVFINGHC